MREHKHFAILVFLLSMCLGNNFAFGQTRQLKTYSGPYSMKSVGYQVEGNYANWNGTANYQYYDAPDGSRIYDGDFEFTSHGAYWGREREYTVKGKFKDDKQVGTWTWERVYHGGYTSDPDYEYVSSITFNEEGKPEGEFNIYVNYTSKYGKRTPYYNFYIKGIIEGNSIRNYSQKDLDGTYSGNIKNGNPIGKWRIEPSKNSDVYYYQMEFDESGNLIRGGYRDNQTGDWINMSSNVPYKAMNKVKDSMRSHSLRSTSKNLQRYRW